jgi:hypothetical protein
MGSKNNPGKFDCLSKAEPDEPMFVLLGRDPVAPILINLWADIRGRMGEEQEKVEEAVACAEACAAWLVAHDKYEKFKEAVAVTEEVIADEKTSARTRGLEELVRKLCSALGTSDEEEELRRMALEMLEEK